MCGIAALFSTQGEISRSSLVEAIASIKHRGPDAQKFWFAPNGRVGLGHARLSIIDLSNGDQPLANETGQIQVVVNGELYGFESIRAKLENQGHRFRTKSDSEIVPHLYERYGTACLQEMRGEFAFVLWDEDNGTLFAARDRFGIKPLYYGWNGNTLVIGSEIKSLFSAGVQAYWDDESNFLHHYRTHSNAQSLFKGVSQVPPGHFLLATSNSIKILPYWDFNYPTEQAQSDIQSPEVYIESLRKKLLESISLRLRADVPVGVYLSGGIDSCAILGMASKLAAKSPTAFSITFDNAAYDEGAIAKESASRVGADFVSIRVTDQDVADHFSDALWHCETLPINPHGVAKYLLSKVVRDAGYKVVLTGEGSDEIFAGYAHHKRDMYVYNSKDQDQNLVRGWLKELEENHKSNPVSGMEMESHLKAPSILNTLGFIPSYLEANLQVGVNFKNFYSKLFLDKFKATDATKLFLNGIDIHGQMTGREPLHQSLYLWSKSILANYLLNILGDRMEMAHSVEGRVPFLDHELVEMVTKIPVQLKIKGNVEKYILREAVKPYISETLYKREKKVFTAPPVLLKVKNPFYNFMQDVLRTEDLKSVPFFDHAKIVELLDKLPNMDLQERRVYNPILMMVLSTTILQKKFKVRF